MGTQHKDIHIGSIIQRKFEESSLTVAEFADRINRARPTVYDIFSRKSIDTELLIKISEVLDYNFLEKVYLDNNIKTELPAISSSRYIVGKEVSEKDLKEYLNKGASVILILPESSLSDSVLREKGYNRDTSL